MHRLANLEGTFDIIYLDAHKGEYIDCLNIVLNKGLLDLKGTILADDGKLTLKLSTKVHLTSNQS